MTIHLQSAIGQQPAVAVLGHHIQYLDAAGLKTERRPPAESQNVLLTVFLPFFLSLLLITSFHLVHLSSNSVIKH